ncbi:MAG TPA: hypothetical protein PKB04_04605 [Phenylobacterium sp.]|uniref:hypothetical protein n=1 Tax=Phenylobacterium sp. TaxID=1871053 RepID=UPI002BA628DB|nr:hypothetical protein [Phenylobacterium sp.]
MPWLWKVDSARDNIISVTPVEGGWAVTSGLSDQPLMFLSGAQAEAKARSLAKLIAAYGGDAQVVVHDRRNVQVGALRFPAQPSGLVSGEAKTVRSDAPRPTEA